MAAEHLPAWPRAADSSTGPRHGAPGQGARPGRMSWLASAAVMAEALAVAACASSSTGGAARPTATTST